MVAIGFFLNPNINIYFENGKRDKYAFNRVKTALAEAKKVAVSYIKPLQDGCFWNELSNYCRFLLSDVISELPDFSDLKVTNHQEMIKKATIKALTAVLKNLSDYDWNALLNDIPNEALFSSLRSDIEKKIK